MTGKATKKPITIEYITFDDFIKHGAKKQPKDAKEHGGFAWSFEYQGYPVTHIDNECYSVPTNSSEAMFTSKDVLITQIDGEIYPCRINIFEETYSTENKAKMLHLDRAKTILVKKANTPDDKKIAEMIGIEGNVLTIPIQDGVIPVNGINGLQVTDLLAYVKEIYISLNTAYPCKENNRTISHIDSAITAQHRRTVNRIKAGIEGTNRR